MSMVHIFALSLLLSYILQHGNLFLPLLGTNEMYFKLGNLILAFGKLFLFQKLKAPNVFSFIFRAMLLLSRRSSLLGIQCIRLEHFFFEL